MSLPGVNLSSVGRPVSLYLETATGHVHTAYISEGDLTALFEQAVTSIVVTTSEQSGHSHSVTAWFDSTINMLVASGDSVSGHTHNVVPFNNVAIIPVYLSEGFNSTHIHTAFLTQQEVEDLMFGRRLSIQKLCGPTSTGTAHTHTVTYTWNMDTYLIESSVTTDLFHSHPAIVGLRGDPYLTSDIKKVTDVNEQTVSGYLRLKHDWEVADGFETVIVDDSEIFLL
jgi:hypothetical protein